MAQVAIRLTAFRVAAALALVLAFAAGSAAAQIVEQPAERQPAERQDGEPAGRGVGDAQAQVRAEGPQVGEDVIGARELLGANVTDGFNHIGSVRDLILTDDGSAVQYVLYEIPYPYDRFGGEDGFVSFERMTLERGAAYGTRVRFDREVDEDAPQTLELTADEANQRLISRIMREPVAFADDERLPLEDVLIDQRTGQITHFVVNMDPDALFAVDPRRIPADAVQVEGGQLVSEAEFAALERLR
jgi:hypothetical protein